MKQPLNELYNPHDTSRDIGWYQKNNMLNQLKVNRIELGYVENAKIQVKATVDSGNLNLNKYLLTPILVFDLDRRIDIVRNKYPNLTIYSVREIDPMAFIELEMCFKILAAYAIGEIDHINLNTSDLEENTQLAELMRTPVNQLLHPQMVDIECLKRQIEERQRPIELAV